MQYEYDSLLRAGFQPMALLHMQMPRRTGRINQMQWDAYDWL